jgi:hypothetical protein
VLEEQQSKQRRTSDSKVDMLMDRLEEFIKTSTEYRTQQQKDIRCLKVNFEAFSDKYTPTLDGILENRKFWVGVKEEIIKKTAATVLLTTVVSIAAASWTAIKTFIKNS